MVFHIKCVASIGDLNVHLSMKHFTLVFTFLITVIVFSQEETQRQELSSRSYDELIDLYDENVQDTIYAESIARAYINKAKEDLDSTKIARGYSRLSFISPYEAAIKYLDTTIYFSRNSKHKNFPTIAFLFKSLYHYNKEAYEESLKDAIKAYQFAKEKNNVEHQISALHQINGINELWGDYQRTLEAEKLTLQLLQTNPGVDRYYEHLMASLEGLGKCYVRLQKPDSALIYFKWGIDKSLEENDSITYYAFVSRTGSAFYLKGAYQRALDSLEKANTKKEFFVNSYAVYFNYYKGLINEKLNYPEKAINYYQKIDSLYEQEQLLTPELPIVFNKLIQYYSAKGNTALEVDYLYKLVTVDSIIDAKQIFIKEKTNSEYTIPSLLEGKERFIEGLQDENERAHTRLIGVLFLLLLVLTFTFYYFRRQKIYRKRYRLLMEKGEKDLVLPKKQGAKSNDLAEDIVNEILEKLETFEKEKEFLSTDISLNEMAKNLGTNSTYLSKVINSEKEQNFSTYINHLRVQFAFRELKRNPTFRKYTIKAIAEECGFKNSESFSKTFYKVYGFYPSYYVKKLKKDL